MSLVRIEKEKFSLIANGLLYDISRSEESVTVNGAEYGTFLT